MANMEKDERRGSLGRALEKFKVAMRRHRSSSKDVPTLANTQTTPKIDDEDANDKSTTVANEAPSETTPSNKSAIVTFSSEAPLEVDDGVPSDQDEPLLPVVMNRTGVDNDRARLLFEKYGLKYEARKRSSEEPPSKMRRVEKPVHIRTHWTCHECNAKFTRDKTCATCGHRRCMACTRAPAKRVREVLESAKQMKQQEDMQRAEADATTPTMNDVTKPTGDAAAERTPVVPLETDNGEQEDDEQAPAQYKYTMSIRPRSGDDLILRPKTQIIRRSCHKCETPFVPASKTECDNCNHIRCTLCPRYPAKTSKWPHGSPGDEQPSRADVQMFPGVQRVYKKPRQRVRYTCDHCQTLFVDRQNCRSCGHERCGDCIRQPPKRPVAPPDPELLQTVNDRIASYITDQRSQVAAAG